MGNKKKCFVIMPISKSKSCTKQEWTHIFEQMIKPAVTGSRLGFTCERAKPRTGSLIRDILNELNTADVVIADLTDMNPNVFYELGVRHTLTNRTILIAQDIKYVPSDLQSYWVILYEKGLQGLENFKRQIRETLREMYKNPDKPDSPVADFLTERNVLLLPQEKSANLRKLTALLSELSYNLRTADAVLKTVEDSQTLREDEGRSIVCLLRFDNACLSLLLSTAYLGIPDDMLRMVRNVNDMMLATNARLDLWGQSGFTVLVEEALQRVVPEIRQYLHRLLEQLSKVRIDYMNDNYREQPTPVVLVSSEEHRQLIEETQYR